MLLTLSSFPSAAQSSAGIKLFRFGEIGNEKPGVLTDGSHLDVSGFGEDYDENFFATDGIAFGKLDQRQQTEMSQSCRRNEIRFLY